MTATAAAPQATRNITAFFVLVFILSLPIYIIALLVPQEMGAAITGVIITLIPMSAALFLTYRESGADGIKSLLKRSFDHRRIKNKIWYLPVLFLIPILFFLTTGLMTILRVPIPEALAPIIVAPIALLVFFFLGVGEEIGWMGYIFDSMEERWNTLGATLVLAVLWILWHLPLYIINTDGDPIWILGASANILGLRILLVWIFKNTGKSVFAVSLAHATINVCTMLFGFYALSIGPGLNAIFGISTAVIIVFLWGTKTLTQFRFKR